MFSPFSTANGDPEKYRKVHECAATAAADVIVNTFVSMAIKYSHVQYFWTYLMDFNNICLEAIPVIN